MSGSLLQKWLLLEAIGDDPKSSKADLVVATYLLGKVSEKKGGYAWPKVETIAQDKSLNRATVIRSIARLEAGGYFKITVVRSRGNFHRYTPNYEVPFGRTDATKSEARLGRTGDAIRSHPSQVFGRTDATFQDHRTPSIEPVQETIHENTPPSQSLTQPPNSVCVGGEDWAAEEADRRAEIENAGRSSDASSFEPTGQRSELETGEEQALEPAGHRDDGDNGFSLFWTVYPHRHTDTSQTTARREFARALANGATWKEIVLAAERYDQALENFRWAMHADKWLREERWKGCYLPAANKPPPPPSPEQREEARKRQAELDAQHFAHNERFAAEMAERERERQMCADPDEIPF
jgi:hypothetical protein